MPNLIFPDDFPPLAADERQAPASSPFLTPSGLFVLEHGRSQDFSSHPHFLEHRSYGALYKNVRSSSTLSGHFIYTFCKFLLKGELHELVDGSAQAVRVLAASGSEVRLAAAATLHEFGGFADDFAYVDAVFAHESV